MASTPKPKKSYYQRNRKKILSQLAERYQKDPTFRKKAQKLARERYHKDPAYRKATQARSRARSRQKAKGKRRK